jgi:hypothetical protein
MLGNSRRRRAGGGAGISGIFFKAKGKRQKAKRKERRVETHARRTSGGIENGSLKICYWSLEGRAGRWRVMMLFTDNDCLYFTSAMC